MEFFLIGCPYSGASCVRDALRSGMRDFFRDAVARGRSGTEAAGLSRSALEQLLN